MTRQMRTFTVVAVALVAACAASYGVYRAFQMLPVKQVEVATGHAVVAARAMPMGTLLTKDDVKLVDWPARSMLDRGFTSIDPVVDRGLITGVTENEPITELKLAPAAAGAGLPPSIPSGMRAVSLKVNEVVGVAGFVVPGTRVDIVAVMRNKDDNVSKTVVANAQVLAAGTRYDQEQATKKDAKPIPSTVVTVLVTPDDAQRIALAQNEGKLQLALRNPLDTDSPALQAVATSGLVGTVTVASSATPAAPAKPVSRPKHVAAVTAAPAPPPPPERKSYVVEMIRAAKRTEEVVR